MAATRALQRAAKAARRRKILKSRRAAIRVSLADKAASFAACPIYGCLMQPEVFEMGMGTIVLGRQAETGEIATAIFLVDAFALGIKDAVFRSLEQREFDLYVATMGLAAPFEAVEPSYARKLLRDAASYAASLGFKPHRGFAATMQLFGNVRAEDCLAEFSFGRLGKPFYVSGPTETTSQIARRLGHLASSLGPDGFDFLVAVDDESCLTSEGGGPVLEGAAADAGCGPEPAVGPIPLPDQKRA